MSLRKVLVIPLLLSLTLFIYHSESVLGSLEILSSILRFSYGLLIILIASTTLQFIGHVIRAYKMRLILMELKESSPQFQFRALAIGYLFNTILPFRLGELVRARIIAAGMNISFSLALVVIIFERAVDAIILGVLGLGIITLLRGGNWMHAFGFPLTIMATGIIIVIALGLLAKPEAHIRKLLYHASGVLNESLKNGFRFKSWSVIYGLQRILSTPKTLLVYLMLSAFSWLAYGASMLVLVSYFFNSEGALTRINTIVAPYYGVAIPAGPANLGVFSDSVRSILSSMSGADIFAYTLVAWAVLVIPATLAGLLLLIFKTKESFWGRLPSNSLSFSLRNKLDRSNDISTSMAVFLENYFSGNTLSVIVHKLEVSGNFRLLRYFKGGSDAITILVEQDKKTIVKKIIPLEFEDRLRAQYNWLAQYRGVKSIVQVLDQELTNDYYTINMYYDSKDVPAFEYVHTHPIANSKQILEKTWAVLDENVYNKALQPQFHPKKRDAYIKKHVLGCLEKAATVDPELLRAAEPERLIINNQPYDNLHVVLRKIKENPQAWRDIATYSESSQVHGDVIIDNLLVNKKSGKVLLIDPAPDGNIINGKVFDFGKNMQSLYCGYEFLLRDEEPVYLREDNQIDYADATSIQYAKLSEYVREQIAPRYLSEAERKAMLFHAAALFIRRLKHQVYYTPANTLKFYAVGVKTFNEFLLQYDQSDS